MLKYNWEDKIKFIEDLKVSSGISDFLGKQNLVSSSGNYDTFKKWLIIHDINKDNYFIKEKNKPKSISIKIVDEIKVDEVLCIESKYTRQEANKIIRKYNLIPYCCEGCENKGTWNGKPITLQLEHKNGNSSDHRVENLEYLCPNCHSQTQTYGSKNKHNKIFEERIKDILEIKILNADNLFILAKKWNLEPVSIYHWLKRYYKKINEYEIDFEPIKKPIVLKKSIMIEEENLLIKNRLEDLIFIKDEIDFENILSEKWKITKNGVRKWIKKYNDIFYQEKYVLTDNYKIKLNAQNIENKIKDSINEAIKNQTYDLSILLPFFNMNSGSCSYYLKNKYNDLHRKYFPVKDCTHCNSEDVRKSGFEVYQGIKQQRYKCHGCKKYFH